MVQPGCACDGSVIVMRLDGVHDGAAETKAAENLHPLDTVLRPISRARADIDVVHQAATVIYVDHFLRERNHQGMGDRLLIDGREVGDKTGEIMCRERLGGLLRYYRREAA
jgi:hypothetical protein